MQDNNRDNNRNNKDNNNPFSKNMLIWVVIIFILIAVFNVFGGDYHQGLMQSRMLSYSEFIEQVESNKVSKVVVSSDKIIGTFNDGKQFVTYIPGNTDVVSRIENKSVQISGAPEKDGSIGLFGILISWFPMLLLIGVWIFFMKQMQGGNNKAMSFGKSKARMLNEKKDKVMFSDVAGVEEAKEDLVEVVEFLRDPGKFQRLGGRIPKAYYY